MKNLGYLLILLCAICLSKSISAQQLPQFSQYMLNPYIINPAIAGCENELQIRSTSKYQWTGITDAPRTFNLSFTNSAFGEKAGYGGLVYTDIAGPTRRIGLQGSGSYISPITESLKFSIALSLGITQYAVDGDKIDVRDIDDPLLADRLSSDFLFDARAGFYLHHEKYFFGFSIPNLTQTDIAPFVDEQPVGVLEPHYNLMAGYNYQINDDFEVQPSVLIKYVEPAPFKIDINVLATYRDQFWIGGGYRINDGIIAQAGANLNNRMMVSYAYDIITSDLSIYSGGVHEFLIGLNISKPEVESVDETSGLD
ncbi:MAG: type IX secretion system membrane protein PorP/SprF [Bacteroidota bacterium]